MNTLNEPSSTIRVITATQLLIVMLGAAMMNIHLRVVRDETPLELFLATKSLWFLVVPILWRGYAVMSQRYNSGLLRPRLAIALGQAMIIVMIATYIYAIYGHG